MERKSRKMSDEHKEKLRKALKDYWATIPYEEPVHETATGATQSCCQDLNGK
jgi:hypothetical protein